MSTPEVMLFKTQKQPPSNLQVRPHDVLFSKDHNKVTVRKKKRLSLHMLLTLTNSTGTSPQQPALLLFHLFISSLCFPLFADRCNLPRGSILLEFEAIDQHHLICRGAFLFSLSIYSSHFCLLITKAVMIKKKKKNLIIVTTAGRFRMCSAGSKWGFKVESASVHLLLIRLYSRDNIDSSTMAESLNTITALT